MDEPRGVVMELTGVLTVVAVWVAVGSTVALVMRRRGHDLAVWLGVGIPLGPFAVPLAVLQARRIPTVPARQVSAGATGPGSLDVLAGVDGSQESLRAVEAAVRRLGPVVRRLTLAVVMDADAALSHLDADSVALWGEDVSHEQACRQALQEAGRRLSDLQPATVLLAGDPARALCGHVAREGFDVLVVGARGRGAATAVLGSVASRLARSCTVPVLIAPPPEPDGAAPVREQAVT